MNNMDPDITVFASKSPSDDKKCII